MSVSSPSYFFFFFNDTATTEIYTLSLHDALPISSPFALLSPTGYASTSCSLNSVLYRRWRRTPMATSEPTASKVNPHPPTCPLRGVHSMGLAQIVTRRVLPQSGTLLVHGRRAAGPPVVALYDLATGDQRWANEGLFEQTEPQKKGLRGLMQRLVTAASEATALQVLQAGARPVVVHPPVGLPAPGAP